MKFIVLILALFLATQVALAQTTCSETSSVLVFGELTPLASSFVQWLKNNIPSNVTQVSSATPVTLASWSPYNLVIFFRMTTRNGPLSAAESTAVYQYVSSGGSVIALSGFDNTGADLTNQQSVFADFGVTYGTSNVATNSEVINTASPLANGVSFLPFVGGWFSTPYMGVGQASYIISSATTTASISGPIGQTVELPAPGGRMVMWGDEWITFALDTSTGSTNFRYDILPAGKTVSSAQFWKNAVAWAGNICVPGATVPPPSTCGPAVTASVDCEEVSVTSTGSSASIVFDSSTSTCGN